MMKVDNEEKRLAYLEGCDDPTTDGENRALWLFLDYNVRNMSWMNHESHRLADALVAHGDRRNPGKDWRRPVYEETVWYEQAILIYADLGIWNEVRRLLKDRDVSHEWKTSGVTFFLHRMAIRAGW